MKMVVIYSKNYLMREANFAHPSPPQTPKAKLEWEDTVRLDSVPVTGASDYNLTSVKLPSVDDLLDPHSKLHGTYRPSGLPHLWFSPNPSPEPYATKEEDVPYAECQIPFHEEDMIVQSLNALRMESQGSRALRPLPPLPGLGGSRKRRHKHKQSSPRQLSSSPKGIKKRVSRSHNDEGHCNVKYVTEELDFIRYFRVDRVTKWDELARAFSLQFPIPGLERTRQGIQGGYYRQNDGQVPEVNNGHALVYLPNGHVKPGHVGVRDQDDKKLFGLVALFPERAMNYRWVDDDTRQIAAELGKPRCPHLRL